MIVMKTIGLSLFISFPSSIHVLFVELIPLKNNRKTTKMYVLRRSKDKQLVCHLLLYPSFTRFL